MRPGLPCVTTHYSKHFFQWCVFVSAPQVSQSSGYFELQLVSVANDNGERANGECCDGPRNPQDRRCTRDECDTYFRACLKEYQTEVNPSGDCTYGSNTTRVLGGNTFSFLGGGGSGGGRLDEAGKIVIPFKFAWPVSDRARLPVKGRCLGIAQERAMGGVEAFSLGRGGGLQANLLSRGPPWASRI